MLLNLRLSAITFAVVCTAATGDALTVYRLGGEDVPEPDHEGAAFDFVQLHWEDVDADRFGDSVGMDIQPGAVAPEAMDANVNLTPTTLDGNFHFLGWRSWEAVQGTGSSYQGWSVRMGDEDADTYYTDYRGTTYLFDLQRLVHLERIRFYTRHDDGTLITCGFSWRVAATCRSGGQDPVPRFLIGTNDGGPARDGARPYKPSYGSKVDPAMRYDFDIAHEGPGHDVVDLSFPSIPTRRLLFQVFGFGDLWWEVAEFEIYASGFVPFARYTSNVIDLGEALSLGELSWAGQEGEDPEARVDITMRSGDDDQPDVFWRKTFRGDEQVPFSESGALLTRPQYNRLGPGEKGNVTHDKENWLSWNAAYDFLAGRGNPNADRPRRFAQFEVAFHSTPESGGRVDYLQFAASPPLVTRATAEIAPAAAAAGEVTSFTYQVRPRIEPGDPGFDGIAIDTPARIVSVEPVARLDGAGLDLTVTRLDEKGFALQIPRIDSNHNGMLIELTFQARVFDYDTPFAARLSDSGAPFEVPQPVTEGDADELNDSNRTRVALTTIPDQSIRSLRLSSPVFSPNGDRVNDVLQIDYELMNLSGAVPVSIAVYDLTGRQVGGVGPGGSAVSGPSSVSWDGTGDQGRLAPGLYLLQLEVETDTGRDRAQRLVAIAY